MTTRIQPPDRKSLLELRFERSYQRGLAGGPRVGTCRDTQSKGGLSVCPRSKTAESLLRPKYSIDGIACGNGSIKMLPTGSGPNARGQPYVGPRNRLTPL